MNALIPKRNINLQNWKKLIISRQVSCKRNGQTIKSSSFVMKTNLCTIYLCKSLDFKRNFSTSSVAHGPQTPNWNREKKYNTFFGGLVGLVIFGLFYAQYAVERHQDYVYVEIKEEKK